VRYSGLSCVKLHLTLADRSQFEVLLSNLTLHVHTVTHRSGTSTRSDIGEVTNVVRAPPADAPKPKRTVSPPWVPLLGANRDESVTSNGSHETRKTPAEHALNVPVSNTLRRRIASQNDVSSLVTSSGPGSTTHRSAASSANHRSNAILDTLSQGMTRDSSAILSSLGGGAAVPQQEDSKLVKPLHPHLHQGQAIRH